MPFSALRRFFSSPKHIAFFFIAILAISLITPALTVHAQTLDNISSLPQNTSSQNDNYLTPNTDPDVPQNQHTYVQSLFIEIVSSLNCIVTGVDPMSPNNQCLGVDQNTGKIGYVQSHGGMISLAGGLIADLYTPPASSSDYIQYLSDNFGITKHTYAADTDTIGSVGLRPLLGIWSTFRNIAYLFFVLGFVIIGFAIMLRLKIDPRTVMTIQNQIPKIIVGLLLITFSYAIAGFLVDMMYASTYLVFNVVGTNITSQGKLDNAQKNFNGENPISFMSDLFGITRFAGTASHEVGSTIHDLVSVHLEQSSDDGKSTQDKFFSWGTLLGAGTGAATAGLACAPFLGPWAIACGAVGAVAGAGAITFFKPSVVNTVTQGVGYALDGLATAATFLIFACAIVIMLFRLWWTLLKAYITILLDVVLAPLWIMGGLFPGSSLTFSSWFRHLIAHLAAFPTVIFLFLLARAIADNFSSGGQLFVPPLIGNPNSSLSYIIGFGFLMIAPNILNMVREALKSKPSQHTGAVGQGFMAGLAPVRMGLQRSWRPYNHQTRQGAGWLRSLVGGRVAGDGKAQGRWQKTFDRFVGGMGRTG